MLKRVSVQDVQTGKISRDQAYLAVVMLIYPRFLKRDLVDEYIRPLAPPEQLFGDFKKKDREIKDHNAAFAWAHYEARFDLSDEGRARLGLLAEKSRDQDVALVCVCREDDFCHCDLELMWACHAFGAKIQDVWYDYPIFRAPGVRRVRLRFTLATAAQSRDRTR